MLSRLLEREQELDGRYKGWRSALYVVRLDYAVIFLLWVIATVVCMVYLTASHGGRFVYDDSYITLKFARNLRQLGQLTFDGTHPGFGVTSPLHVALIALLSNLTRRIEFAAILLGFLSLGLASTFGYYWSKAVTGSRRIGAVSSLLMASSGWMVFDALSGMETMLFIMFLLLALWLFEKKWPWFGIPLALAVMTRPDGWFFAIGLLIYELIDFAISRDWKRLRRLGISVGLFALTFLPYLIINLRLTGSLLPNTALAKAYFFGEPGYLLTFKLELAWRGISHFYAQGITTLPFVIALGLLLSRKFWSRYYLLITCFIFYAAYILIFPGSLEHYWSRYQHIFIPFLMLAVAEGTFELTRLMPTGRRRMAFGWLMAGILLTNQVASLITRRQTYSGATQSIEQVGADVARFIRAHSQPGDTIATHDIGALGYFAQRPVLDLVGLVNPDIQKLYRDPKTGELIQPRDRNILPYLLGQHPRYLVIFEAWKHFLNFDPDKLTSNFVFLGESRPVFPNPSGGYRIYGIKYPDEEQEPDNSGSGPSR